MSIFVSVGVYNLKMEKPNCIIHGRNNHYCGISFYTMLLSLELSVSMVVPSVFKGWACASLCVCGGELDMHM